MPSESVHRGTEMESKHMIGESNTDWNKVLDYVRGRGTANENPLYVAAIQLVERMAKGELVERPTVEQAMWPERFTKQPTPGQEALVPAPVCPDEREHCERVSQELFLIPVPQRVDLLIRERAAVRAERAGLEAELETARAANAACEAIIASAHEAADTATENYDKVAAEVQALKREVERRDNIILELRDDRAEYEAKLAERSAAEARLIEDCRLADDVGTFREQNAEIERLKARVRELEQGVNRILDSETIKNGMDYHHALQELIGE